MILLTSTAQSVELVTGNNQSVDWIVSWVDITDSTFTPNSTDGNVAAATTTTVVAAPAANTQRQVKHLSVRVAGASTNQITIQKNSGTARTIFKVSLATGEELQYTDGEGFRVFDANGNLKVTTTPGGGSNINVSAGTTSNNLTAVTFSNSNGVSFGLNGSVVTASVVAAAALTNIRLSAGTTNNLGSAFSFADSNGIGFGINASTITASHNGLTNVRITAGTTNTAASNYSFGNANNVSFGLNGQTITGSASFAQSNQQMTMFATGNTTQSSSGTSNASSLIFRGEGIVSVGVTNGSVVVSATGGGGGGSVNFSAGTTSNNLAAVTFSNSNGVSFGLNGSTMTGSVAAGATATGNLGAIAGGTQTATSGTVVFSDSNGITFGLSGSTRMTASHNGITSQSNQQLTLYATGNTTQSSSGTSNASSLVFRGDGIASVGITNGSVLISVPAGGGGLTNINLSAGTTSNNLSAFTLSNSNNVSFGLNVSTVTASASFPAQTNQTLGLYASSNTTLTSSGTADARSLSFRGIGGVTVGVSASEVLISGAQTVAQTNQTIGGYALGNTTAQSSSTTMDARSLSFSGLGIASVGYSAGAVVISVPAGGGAAGTNTLGMSNLGNTVGTSGVVSGSALQFVLAGGNNVTLSQSINGSSATITISAFNQSVQSLGLYASSNTTLTSSGTADARSLSFRGIGGATVGVSASEVLISAPVSNQAFSAQGGSSAFSTLVFTNSNGISFSNTNGSVWGSHNGITSQTNQQMTLFATGNTTQSSTGTTNASSVIFAGSGNVSVGITNGSVVISGAGGGGGGNNTAGISNLGNTSGTSGVVSGSAIQLVLAGGNNVTLSQSINGSSATITVSAFNQSNQNLSLYALGNTTQNSSSVLNASALSFNALGAMTWGYSNGSIQASAPATSSLSATGQVSISTNGSTISIGVPNDATLSAHYGAQWDGSWGSLQYGNGSAMVWPFRLEAAVAFSQMRFLMSATVSTSSNSSHGGTLSVAFGIYTRNGSTLSQSISGSRAINWTNTSNNSTASLNGLRDVTLGLAGTLTPGDYWGVFWSRTSTANANWVTLSNIVESQFTNAYSGEFGAAANATRQMLLGLGIFSATSSTLNASYAFSHISGDSGTKNLAPLWQAFNVTA